MTTTSSEDVFAQVMEYGGDRPGKQVFVWCPGCDWRHPFTIEAPPGPNGDRLNNGITWEWDGNLERPTFSPSLIVFSSVHLCNHTYWVCPAEKGGECEDQGHLLGYELSDGTAIPSRLHEPAPDGAPKIRIHSSPHDNPAWGSCHSFLRQGMWQFLSDSAHSLAGQTVPMVPLKYLWGDDA